MSEGKRKRIEDHYVARYKPNLQHQQQEQHQSQNHANTLSTNPILQQQIIVNPVITHAEQINENEQIQILNGNLTNNQSGQSNLVYIILPSGVNQTQNLLQGLQTVLLVPKDEQGNFVEGSSQVQYCLPVNENINVEPQTKKAEDVVLVKDVKVLKQEPGASVEYLQSTPQTDPLQIQSFPESNSINCPGLPAYGEPAMPENIFVLNTKDIQKIRQIENVDVLKHKVQFKCDYPGCILSFPSLYEKKIHADTHIFQAGSEFKCNICNLSFKVAGERNKHVDSHAIVSTYKCKNCEKTFPYYTTLVKHVNEEKCASDKSFSCHYCGVQFVDIIDLERHQKENVKHCICHAKICSDPAFELHTTLCTLYKQKMGNTKRPRVKSKSHGNNSSNSSGSSSEVIVLD
ncbi:hypothetical protein ILUMI_23603 [Ignelater luminosus]|uniref:C2H2-type domain-containing protein n=1 Tax=Ignelater luminosus TaxID=2038154 RepID=A0A8K0G1H1_IGNLU|nr:hypothetical protein ILUMI_23603 [Ignelater luminosus]